jgi:maltose-binding protein MalE
MFCTSLHCFSFCNSGELTYLDVPDSKSTLVYGINDNRVMVGWYWDSNYYGHGFVLKPGATFFSYDFPGSYESHLGGINNRGLICGDYGDATGNHGFIARIR